MQDGTNMGGAPAGAASGADGTVAELQSQASLLYRGGQLRGALRACREILALEAGRADVLSFAGLISLQLGEPAEAAAFYGEAVAARPDYAEAHYNLGNALKALERMPEAVRAYQRAIELKPDLAAAYHNMGNALQGLGRLEEAAEAYRKGLEIAPDAAETQRNLGIVRQMGGRLEEAAEAYRRAIEIRPGWHQIHNNLTTVLMELGDARGALAACQEWLALTPGDVEATAYKCAALNELGERDALGYLLDFDRFVREVRHQAPPGYASLAEFNQALARHVLAHPTLKVPPEGDPTYHHPSLHVTEELLAEPKGPMAELERMMLRAVEDYRAGLPDEPDHPFIAHWPRRWKLSSWGAVLTGEGNLEPHIHMEGYLGGVYYPRIPAVAADPSQHRAGWFELGRPPDALHGTAEPTVLAIQPEEGLMLLFPGYFYHRTVPFASGETRVSIAFDVVPEGVGVAGEGLSGTAEPGGGLPLRRG